MSVIRDYRSVGNYFQAHDILGLLFLGLLFEFICIIYYYLIRIFQLWMAFNFYICNFDAMSVLICINRKRASIN